MNYMVRNIWGNEGYKKGPNTERRMNQITHDVEDGIQLRSTSLNYMLQEAPHLRQ